MSLISDSLRRVAEQRAGRKEPPAVPRMLAGQGPQHKKRLLLFLGLTFLLAGAVIGVVAYSLIHWGGDEREPAEAVSPAQQQIIFEKFPPPSKPIQEASHSEPQPSLTTSGDQRTPATPKVVQVAIEQEPARAEKKSEYRARVVEKDQGKQVAAATPDEQKEASPEADEQRRQPSSRVKIGVVSLQSARQVVAQQDPATTKKNVVKGSHRTSEPLSAQTNVIKQANSAGEVLSAMQRRAQSYTSLPRLARIRSGPTIDALVLQLIPRGTRLQVIGRKGNWLELQLRNGNTGWLYHSLAQPQRQRAEKPLIDEPMTSPVEEDKTDERVAVAAAKRVDPVRPVEVRPRRAVKTGKSGLVELQSENTAGAPKFYRQAVAYQKAMKWQEAIGAYQRVLKIEPMSAEVYNNIGVCYEKQGKLQMATKSYERAISINPRFYRSYNNLGIIYYKLKDFNKARAAYEQALQLNPGNSQSEINLSLIYERLRRGELARRTLERVLVNDPKNAAAHYNLGRILEEQGDPEGAITHYRQFLALNSSAYPQLREKVKERVRTLQEASSK